MRCFCFLSVGSALLSSALFVASPARAGAAEHPHPIEVKLTLVPPRDILVDWKDPAPGAAGHVIEWGTKPDDEFVPLGFFQPNQTRYRHVDLMWDTPSYYRVRAYYGPASPDLEISLPSDLSDAEYKQRYEKPEDYRWALPTVIPDPKPVEKKSIRDSATASDAAPTDFKITLQPVTVSAFKLTWTDRASDEEGTMIELKKEGSSEFEVVAMVEPNVNSFGWAFEPPVRKGTFRVRPYYFGPASELVHENVGKEPEEKSTPKAESPDKKGP